MKKISLFVSSIFLLIQFSVSVIAQQDIRMTPSEQNDSLKQLRRDSIVNASLQRANISAEDEANLKSIGVDVRD